MKDSLKKILAALAAVFGIGVVIWCVYDLITGYSREKPSILVTLAVFYAAAAGWAIHWLVRKTDRERRTPEDNEKILLRLMTDKGGRITPTEAATETGLPVTAVRDLLGGLTRKGLCELRATVEGAAIYVVKEPVPEGL